MASWSTTDIPAQTGRTAVVTGANSGLGLETARALAVAGARVVLAVRDPTRGTQAAANLPGEVEVRRLDLADLSSVREFAAGWSGDLDVLVNNAGIMHVPAGRTADGFELQFGTNHLGHFALTNLLLPHVTDRVVTVSSMLHRSGEIVLDDLNWERRPYSATGAYGQSKLANLLFTLELQRRLTAAGSTVRALAAHPGWAATNLQGRTGNRVKDAAMAVANRALATSAQQGALPTLFAAVADLPGGGFTGPDGTTMRGAPTLAGRSPAASDPAMAERLWAASAGLTGTDLPAQLPG
ncbi:oxidoreductase [Modestobacter marinus]|uniref:NAD(P)-dependent dehydrogenase (Short-subunit alcohol dehydrogenase family) n=1 Tax=Modestobacter marinus TaxID=477641 RepID=A0A846LLU6_9ACTN|nr:oxidoreductase [Modestobacter marinus]NIH68371.1 NAD(P)-dependent dehydrogenase (short-subunit alcohol dehydrogenase family) [Modestobacter marinus]GGL56706.1 short-chain dehydrogenase [Modestobacter marinus]